MSAAEMMFQKQLAKAQERIKQLEQEKAEMGEALGECGINLRFLSNHLAGRMGEGALAEMERLADEAFEVLAKAEGKS